MNVRSELERRAVADYDDSFGDVRFDFVRSAPDLAAFMIALRTEMSMRIVMPEVLPHTEAEPYMAMARFETGEGGNPHFHGFSIGAGGPRLGRVDADMDREVVGDLAPGSADEDGEDAEALPVSGDEMSRDAPFERGESPGVVDSPALAGDEQDASRDDADPFEIDADDARETLPVDACSVSEQAPPVPTPPAGFVRPARKKQRVKRELLPRASAVSFPDV